MFFKTAQRPPVVFLRHSAIKYHWKLFGALSSLIATQSLAHSSVLGGLAVVGHQSKQVGKSEVKWATVMGFTSL